MIIGDATRREPPGASADAAWAENLLRLELVRPFDELFGQLDVPFDILPLSLEARTRNNVVPAVSMRIRTALNFEKAASDPANDGKTVEEIARIMAQALPGTDNELDARVIAETSLAFTWRELARNEAYLMRVREETARTWANDEVRFPINERTAAIVSVENGARLLDGTPVSFIRLRWMGGTMVEGMAFTQVGRWHDSLRAVPFGFDAVAPIEKMSEAFERHIDTHIANAMGDTATWKAEAVALAPQIAPYIQAAAARTPVETTVIDLTIPPQPGEFDMRAALGDTSTPAAFQRRIMKGDAWIGHFKPVWVH